MIALGASDAGKCGSRLGRGARMMFVRVRGLACVCVHWGAGAGVRQPQNQAVTVVSDQGCDGGSWGLGKLRGGP